MLVTVGLTIEGIMRKPVMMAVLVLGSVATAGAGELTATEQLGKQIFFDKNLSINRNQSCATCHAAEVGWTGLFAEQQERCLQRLDTRAFR